jgi:hypothetical protein
MNSPFPRARLHLESLDQRVVPSATPDVDLTSAGASGSLNGALFLQSNTQPTGTGVIDSFVRLQAHGAGAQVEQGYNTDARPLQFDEKNSPNFTRSLLLSDIPTVNIGGIVYRQFLLDINQKSSQPFLSLDQLRLFVGGSGDLTGYDTTTGQLAGLSAVWDLDSGGDHWVKLDARLTHGSGSGDMLFYVPDSVFAGAAANSFVYLYSRFGDNFVSDGGFEEWAVTQSPLVCTHGTISGTAKDTNGVGIPNTFVFIDANNDGAWDDGEVFTYTDAFGHYEFDSLAAGLGALSTYNITVVPPAGFTPASPTSVTVSLLNCGDLLTVDFLFFPQPPNS